MHPVNTEIIVDPVEKAIEVFKSHPSIIRINQEGFAPNKFSFQYVTENDISLVIKNIDASKSYQKENIPPKLLKDNDDICALVIYNDMNQNISKGQFPSNLKHADISPILKKFERLLKVNYRPVSILPTKCMYILTAFFLNTYVVFEKDTASFLCWKP